MYENNLVNRLFYFNLTHKYRNLNFFFSDPAARNTRRTSPLKIIYIHILFLSAMGKLLLKINTQRRMTKHKYCPKI